MTPSWQLGRNLQEPDVQKSTEKPKETTGESFFSGVVVLTVSGLLVKALGMFFKIPMNYIVGDTSMGYYNAAYTLYTFFYMLSTAGLPTAVSILVSNAHAAGRKAEYRRIFTLSMALFCGIGILGTGVMLLFAKTLADWIGSPPAVTCILVVAPTLFFICIASALRGYHQGCTRMMPTAVSQLIEALGKVVVGIAAAQYAIKQGRPPYIVAAYAAAGLTVGAALGMLYLLCTKWHIPTADTATENTPSTKYILKHLLAIALPITIGSAVMSLTNLLDTALLQRLLQQNGMTQEAATTLYGNYTSLAVPLFNLPPSLVYPIAYAIVPRLAGKTKKDTITMALRLSVWIGAPCSLGMMALAGPILSLLYRASSAQMAAPLLTLLAPSSLLVCILAVTNSTLQAVGKANLPVLSMLLGGSVKCMATWLLFPQYGIAAAPIGTFLCYLTVTTANLLFLLHHTKLSLDMGKTFVYPMLAGGICALTAKGAYQMFLSLAVPGKLTVLLSIGCGALIYLLLVFFLLGTEERAFLMVWWADKQKNRNRSQEHGKI